MSKIEPNQVYQSNCTPTITAKVERVEDKPEGCLVHLVTAGDVKIQIPVAELEKNWSLVNVHYYRYFISYVSGGIPSRCGVSRQKPIESIADVQEIERFLTEENMKGAKSENPDEASATVTGWQTFETAPGILERAAVVVNILGFISVQDKTGIGWWTPALQSAIEEVLA